MASVFIKVPVSERHIDKWCFYLTPIGFKGFGLIEKPSVVQGLYRCNGTYVCFVLEEIELPTEEEIKNSLFEQGTTANYGLYQSGYEDCANFILNKLKKKGG